MSNTLFMSQTEQAYSL